MADPNDDSGKDEGSEGGAPEGASERESASDPSSPAELPARAADNAAKKKSRPKTADPGEIRDRNRKIREEAAAKRRSKRESDERRAAPARNLEASEIVDDALARTTHAAANFLKRNFNIVQWLVVALVVGGLGYQIYKYRHGISVARASEELTQAMRAERARVGDDGNGDLEDRYVLPKDTRQTFASDDQRLKSAEAEYRKAKGATSGTISTLATLGLAGILFDSHKYADAKAAYEQVKNSDLASRDSDAKARAIEGMGLSLEELGKDDEALRSFKELENIEVAGASALGQYHQARILFRKGERDKAKELLKKAQEKLAKLEDKDTSKRPGAAPGFLSSQVSELLVAIDPSAAVKAPGAITQEQIEKLQQELKQSGGGGKQLDAKKLQELLGKLRSSGAPTPGPAAPGTPQNAPAPAPSPEPESAP